MPDPIPSDLPPQPSTPTSRRVSPWWRALAIFLALVLFVGWAAGVSMFEQLRAQVGHLQSKLQALPQVRYVSVLLDAEQRPAMLVTHDPSAGVLDLQRLNSVKEGREDSMQLWALAEGQPPRSLGVITSPYKTLQLPVQGQDFGGVTQLAISVENKGGVPSAQGPRLPYLFIGGWVQRAI